MKFIMLSNIKLTYI